MEISWSNSIVGCDILKDNPFELCERVARAILSARSNCRIFYSFRIMENKVRDIAMIKSEGAKDVMSSPLKAFSIFNEQGI